MQKLYVQMVIVSERLVSQRARLNPLVEFETKVQQGFQLKRTINSIPMSSGGVSVKIYDVSSSLPSEISCSNGFSRDFAIISYQFLCTPILKAPQRIV